MSMQFDPIKCPECGEYARGTVETLAVWWDEQRSQKNEEGQIRLICPEAHEWWAVKTETDIQADAEEAS